MNLPNTKFTSKKGFTLVELIVVIGMLAILLAVVLVAINPARRFQDTQDAQRRSDVNAILNAIHQSAADNNGTLPAGIDSTGAADSIQNPVTTPDTQIDLCAALVTAGYLGQMPIDPNGTAPTGNDCAQNYNTGYTVAQNTNGSVTVAAPNAVNGPIQVTR